MDKKATDWTSPETWQRVVAAIIATGVKVDLKATAKYYGTTYDTLENRFRKIKKDAQVLKEEVETGLRSEVVPARKSNPSTPRKPKTPKKDALNSVANGRISKTPTKRSIKQEDTMPFGFDDLTDSFTTGDIGSFDADTSLYGSFD